MITQSVQEPTLQRPTAPATSSGIDAIKALAILLVILGHTPLPEPLGKIIYLFHVPLFFFASGLVASYLGRGLLTLKQARRLAGTFVTFVIVGVSATRLKDHWLHRPEHAWSTMLVDSLRWGNIQHMEHHYGFVLWFIPSLFAALALLEFARLQRSRKAAAGIILTALAVAGTLSASLPTESIPYSLNTLSVSTPFVMAGHGARQLAHLPRWPVVILGLTGLVLYTFVPGSTALNVAYFSPVMLAALPVSMLGVLALYRLLGHLSSAPSWVTFLGRNSLPIFVLHVYTNNLFSIIWLQPIFIFIGSLAVVSGGIVLLRRFGVKELGFIVLH